MWASVPLIRPRKAERVSPFAEIIAAEEVRDLEEHWRLLYVGLTRAEERLVIAGLQPKVNGGVRPENSWHLRVERALVSLGRNPMAMQAGVRCCATVAPSPPVRSNRSHRQLRSRDHRCRHGRIPQLLARRGRRSRSRLHPLGEDSEAAPPPSEAQRAAAERGTFIHQLLERLAPVHADERHATALRWLERSAGVSDGAARKEIADTVCSVLSEPRFSALFGEGSLAEAPLAATLPDGRVVAGTVDRLLVEADRRLGHRLQDRAAFRNPASAIPPSHRAQMSAYTEALRVIFPGREVRAVLLYTSGPRLFELQC